MKKITLITAIGCSLMPLIASAWITVDPSEKVIFDYQKATVENPIIVKVKSAERMSEKCEFAVSAYGLNYADPKRDFKDVRGIIINATCESGHKPKNGMFYGYAHYQNADGLYSLAGGLVDVTVWEGQ